MSVQVEKLEKNMAKLTVTVAADVFEKAVKDAYNKNKSKFNIQGFRKGKAPFNMIVKMYGPEVFYDDAVNALLPTEYSAAAAESGLEIVSRPTIDIEEIGMGKDLVFTAEVAVKPEVKLGQYKGIEVEKAEVSVSEEEIAAEIDKERDNNSRMVTVEDRAVENGDTVTLDFEGFVDGVAFEGGKGTDYPLVIGAGQFIPGFEEELIGAEIGVEKDVNVTFPEDYHSEDLKGKAAVFKCTVKKITKKELPELDDDFAQDVSDFDTLEEYKADVAKKLEEKKAKAAKEAKENQAVEAAANNAEMEIPEAMIETQAEQSYDEFAQRLSMQGLSMEQYMQFTGSTQESMIESMKPQALQRIKTRLMLEAVVAAENILVSDEEIEAEVAKMAEQYQMEAEQIKGILGDDAMEQIKMDLAVQKAVDMIAETAVEK